MHLPRNALALVLAPVAVGWAATCPAQKRLFLKDVEIGEHWYGAKVGLDDLEGKVVLFAYWGASPGCRELVPHLLRASQDLADRPIHIILTYVEDRPKQQTVAYFAGLGLQQDCPNITLTNDGKHPQVKSKSYVPYYMVFDHRGRLVHHHMGGEYHSGDKRQMIEWLQKLSADVPDFYFGTQPFLKIAPLVERATEKKKLAGAIREAEAMLAPPADQPKPDPATKAELQRLLTVIARYRDRKLKSIELIYPRQPTKVLRVPRYAAWQGSSRRVQEAKELAAAEVCGGSSQGLQEDRRQAGQDQLVQVLPQGGAQEPAARLFRLPYRGEEGDREEGGAEAEAASRGCPGAHHRQGDRADDRALHVADRVLVAEAPSAAPCAVEPGGHCQPALAQPANEALVRKAHGRLGHVRVFDVAVVASVLELVVADACLHQRP
jgi:hypothetical protein